MTLREVYRQVFNAPGGNEVLADISRHVETLGGTAGQLLGHIVRQLHENDPAPREPRPDPTKMIGGRLPHG